METAEETKNKYKVEIPISDGYIRVDVVTIRGIEYQVAIKVTLAK